jgi:hypothetical protein
LCWGGGDESLDAVETGDLFLPFLCGKNRVDDGGEDGLDGVGVHSLDDAESSGCGGVLDWHQLITNSRENRWEKDDEVWLDGGGDFRVLRNSLDSVESAFSCVGILFVS